MSSIGFCLKILSDDIYDYRCYTFKGTNSAQSREVAKRLKEIEDLEELRGLIMNYSSK